MAELTMVFFKREAPTNMADIDISSYNLQDPADIEKFFLANHAELMSMMSVLSENVSTIQNYILELDLYTLPEDTVVSLSSLMDANFKVHETIITFFQALMQVSKIAPRQG
jgi:hypothetical protein